MGAPVENSYQFGKVQVIDRNGDGLFRATSGDEVRFDGELTTQRDPRVVAELERLGLSKPLWRQGYLAAAEDYIAQRDQGRKVIELVLLPRRGEAESKEEEITLKVTITRRHVGIAIKVGDEGVTLLTDSDEFTRNHVIRQIMDMYHTINWREDHGMAPINPRVVRDAYRIADEISKHLGQMQ